MIEFKGVSKEFIDPDGHSVVAVADLDLTIADGETVALIGTSGCGKTTTMKLVNRLIEPTAGTVVVRGTDVRRWDPIRLRRQIGYVIQTGGLFPHMSVRRNIGLLAQLDGWLADDVRERSDELLRLVNLDPNEFGHRYPRELSGGQRQRVGVARALVLDPPYVLMDEPFGALDPLTRDQLHEEFLQLQKRIAKTIVLVTHDMAEAFLLADRVALMDQGRIVQLGSESEFRKQPVNEFVAEFLRSHLGASS